MFWFLAIKITLLTKVAKLIVMPSKVVQECTIKESMPNLINGNGKNYFSNAKQRQTHDRTGEKNDGKVKKLKESNTIFVEKKSEEKMSQPGRMMYKKCGAEKHIVCVCVAVKWRVSKWPNDAVRH